MMNCSSFCSKIIYLASWTECLACEIDNVRDNVPVGCLAWNIHSKIHRQLLQRVNSLQINIFWIQWTTNTREAFAQFSVYGVEFLVWYVYAETREREVVALKPLAYIHFVLFYSPNNKSWSAAMCDVKIINSCAITNNKTKTVLYCTAV